MRLLQPLLNPQHGEPAQHLAYSGGLRNVCLTNGKGLKVQNRHHLGSFVSVRTGTVSKAAKRQEETSQL